MDSEEDDQLFTTFSHKEPFLALLTTFLDSTDRDDAEEDKLVAQMGAILDIYLPAPPLLDPHLHLILPPLIATIRSLLVEALAAPSPHTPSAAPTASSSSPSEYPEDVALSPSTKRLGRLGRLLWWVLKVRGWRGCLSSFPPSLPSLPLLLSLFHPFPHPTILPSTSWELRYILLVWLSLVSMIPFGLESAGGEGTIDKLESVGTKAVWEGRGKEGEGGAVLLGRLFARTDCTSLLPSFLAQSTTLLATSSGPSSSPTNPFLKSSILTTLCHFIPSSPSPSQIVLVRDWLSATLPSSTKDGSGLIRKLRIKLLGRCALSSLGGKGRQSGQGRKRLLGADGSEERKVEEDEDEIEVPEEVEDAVEELMSGLEDKDTIVRWSSAKYISRLSANLPLAFADQIAEAVISLFGRDAILLDDDTYDLSAVKEATWHGASLAVAELARRGVLNRERLAELVPWLLRAMTFDPRTSSHSTGTSVRDASCYVLWSLARAFTKGDMAPYALALSRQAVALAVADREVSIRRAGSAAFQENVGRMGLFPHGIDVLVKTDFYSVSVRRSAFLVAAPQVAQHEIYRSFLLEHFSRTTLKHWDKEMRQLGASALRALVEINLDELGPKMVDQLISDLKTMDSMWTHGILLALSQFALSYRDLDPPHPNDQRHKIFSSLLLIRPATFRSFSGDLQLSAGTLLIANSVTSESLASPELDRVWRDLAELCLKSRSEEVQEGLACVWGSVSRLISVEEDLKTFNTMLQQTIGKVVGRVEYEKTPGCDVVVKRLLDMVEPGSKDFVLDVEARRNAFEAICNIVSHPSVRNNQVIESPLIYRVLAALFRGLDDYTSDQRGDVGSWIRVACLRGATAVIISILDERNPNKWLNVVTFHGLLGKVLKLSVERIDGVRKVAGECLKLLVEERPERKQAEGGAETWEVPGVVELRELFTEPDAVRWNEASSVFPRAVPLTSYTVYRRPLLEGLTLSIGSRSEGTTRTAARAFLAYIATLPPSSLSPTDPSLLSLARSLVEIATANVTLNRVFIPVLDTLVLLFEDGDLARLSESASGKAAVRTIFSVSCRDLGRVRNVQRVTSSMKILTGMISVPSCAAEAVRNLPALLNHRFPTVRAATAEQVYLVLQTVDLPGSDEIEELLLSTSWSSEGTEQEAKQVVDLLLASVSSS